MVVSAGVGLWRKSATTVLLLVTGVKEIMCDGMQRSFLEWIGAFFVFLNLVNVHIPVYNETSRLFTGCAQCPEISSCDTGDKRLSHMEEKVNATIFNGASHQ